MAPNILYPYPWGMTVHYPSRGVKGLVRATLWCMAGWSSYTRKGYVEYEGREKEMH